MYKAAVRWMIRRNIASLNAGDYRPALAMFSDDVEFSFPGDNSWANEHRPSEQGRLGRAHGVFERLHRIMVRAGVPRPQRRIRSAPRRGAGR